MGKNYDFDYIIIGSGPAGRTAAAKLAEAKKEVAIIEADNFGGAEITTRDLPFKLGLDFANTFYKFTTSPAINDKSCHFNFPTLAADIDNHIVDAENHLKSDLKTLGVKIIDGYAHFLDPHTVAIEENKYTAKFFILATGSHLKATEISGLSTVDYLTPDTVFQTRRLPRYVFVVGGGPTGVEIAEFFALLGVGVIIMERGAHLLPREDDEVANIISTHLEDDLGVNIITSAKVTAITEDYNSKIVVFMNGQSEKMVRVDTIVIATGSEPTLDCGLENAGVDYKRTGIIVDKYFNTTAKNIFAIGDCINDTDSSTARAKLEARTLVENLLHRQKITPKYSSVARSINTHPAIAVLGLNEHDAVSRDLNYHRDITYLDGHHTDSFVKILTDSKNRFLGASIVADQAPLALELKKLLTK